MKRTMYFLKVFLSPALMLAVLIAGLSSCGHVQTNKQCVRETVKKGKKKLPEYSQWVLWPGPAENDTVTTDPAAFHWPPDTLAKGFIIEISGCEDFHVCEDLLGRAMKKGGLIPESLTATPEIMEGENSWVVAGLPMPLYRPSFTMGAGTWYWRWRSVFEGNKISKPSASRKFTIVSPNTVYTVPPVAELLKRIPEQHPRLFIRPEKLDSLRGLLKTSPSHKAFYARIKAYADSLLLVPINKEPEKLPEEEVSRRQLWRKQYDLARKSGQVLDFLGFCYMMSGEKKYAERAKEWLMIFVSWDPEGNSSMSNMDEVAMPILLNGARAYDWMYDYLTDEERTAIRKMLRIRGEQAYQVWQKWHYYYKPYISHPTRLISYMTQVGVVLHGEVKEADKWLGYALPVVTTFYPPWGGRDGGYSEGPSYWMMYFNYMLQSAYCLRTAMDLDILKTDFYRNAGWFKIYAYPYYGALRPFADTGIGTYWPADKINMYRLATVFHNPYYRWRAEMSPPKEMPVAETIIPTGVMNFFWLDEGPDHVKPKPPDGLPGGRLFRDVGLVAFHEDLGNPMETYFLLKSSPYGAWSHAYADQNAFYIQAFGEALAIQSGYYPSYGCPHHRNWTWKTIAHNTILVDGKGQKIRDRASKGKIIAFRLGNGSAGSVDYAAGDATEAYQGRLNKFIRHVYYERPRDFLLIDELEAPKPVRFNWLFHALNKMKIDAANNRVIVTKGKARLIVDFLTPDELTFSQTNKFTIAPGPFPDEKTVYPDQWHLTVSTKDKATAATFMVKMKVEQVK